MKLPNEVAAFTLPLHLPTRTATTYFRTSIRPHPPTQAKPRRHSTLTHLICMLHNIRSTARANGIHVRQGISEDIEGVATVMAHAFCDEQTERRVRSSFMSRVGGDDTALEIYELLSKVEVRWQLRRRMVRAARANGSGTGQTRHVLLVAVDEDSEMLVGCVEMGVVNVPRLLAKGAHNEVEQWEQAAEGMLSTDTSDRAPYIGNLAVSPRQRRRGVGTQLMRAAVAYAQHEWHSTAVWLHVEAENEAAKRLYARLGFDCEVQEPTWYRHIGRDRRLFLRCDIAPEGEGGVADDLVTGDAGEDGGVDDEEVEMQLKAWEDARVGGKPVRGLEYLRYCWYDLGRRRRENGG